MASVELTDLTVSRAGRLLLDAVNLRVPDGERIAVLGGSGAGKTTLLRAIAGFERIDRGSIRFDDQEVTDVPGRERGVAMVAQSAELLPHRDVAGNIGFPLELRHLPREEVDRRVRAQARAFQIGGLLGRRSSVLSAGETAEVAVARAFVRKPTVMLLDEPFARIDGPTRSLVMRDMIRVQEGYGATLLIATNDQDVALSVSRTIAVLSAGQLVQVGGPRELFEQPASVEVAGLLGEGPLNLLPARLSRDDGRTVLSAGPLRVPTWDLGLTERASGPVQLGVRPADLTIQTDEAEPRVAGHVVRHAFLGDVVEVTVATEDAQLVVRCPRPAARIGSRVDVTFRRDRLHVFDPSGASIAHGV